MKCFIFICMKIKNKQYYCPFNNLRKSYDIICEYTVMIIV